MKFDGLIFSYTNSMALMEWKSAMMDGGLHDFRLDESAGFAICGRSSFSSLQ